jgi:protein SERAC1
MVPWSSSA